jgi:glucosylceramidase
MESTGASELHWWLSTRDGGIRLTEQPPIPAGTGVHGSVRLCVDTTRRFQRMVGFGGAFTEAAAHTWLRLSAGQREAFLRDCFHPTDGHGYTLCRVHMNSCDFSRGNYAHVEKIGDEALNSFSIARDEQALIPMIQAAQQVAGRPLRILASPWSPPGWMKDTGQMNEGGRLLPRYRAAWANCFVRFIQAYRAHGISIWGVSVQNEPEAHQRWDSCLYTAQEERDFVRDYLGPALCAAGLSDIRIVVWDHNRDVMVERASVIYGDAEAAKYVWGMGFHWYGEDHFDHVQLVHDAWPDKQLLFTEGCQEGGPHHGSWGLAERYARSMINDINRWTVGWIDWNILLDEGGGPNHVGNFCSAPVLADCLGDRLLHQSSYAALGHFSRFVQPGAQRVLCASTRQAIECCAFVDETHRTTVIAFNRGDEALPVRLSIDGTPYELEMPAHAISTWVSSAS